MKRLIIIGAGGLGREVLAWAGACNSNRKIKGFLDDNPSAANDLRLRAPVLGPIETYVPAPDDVFFCAIGNPVMRRLVTERFKAKGGAFMSIIHPTAVVAPGAKIGEGVIVCPYTVISADALLKDGVVVYYHSSVDHDAVVGPFAQISGHCDIMGGASIGAGVFLGSHAAILPRVKVGDRAIVGAGAIVTRDVPSDATVVGVPARLRAVG